MTDRTRKSSEEFINETASHVRETTSMRAGHFATVVSAVALLFSGYSFYETALKAANINIYVPPRIDYTDPDRPDSPLEVFILPLTLANSGARTGTILSIDLKVTNLRTKQIKRFYASHLGSWGQTPRQPFTPVALQGRSTYSHAIQFVPRVGEKIARILDIEPGTYQFELTLNAAVTGRDLPFLKPKIRPLKFEMQIGQLDYRNFTRAGTMAMWSKDYRPATTKDE